MLDAFLSTFFVFWGAFGDLWDRFGDLGGSFWTLEGSLPGFGTFWESIWDPFWVPFWSLHSDWLVIISCVFLIVVQGVFFAILGPKSGPTWVLMGLEFGRFLGTLKTLILETPHAL